MTSLTSLTSTCTGEKGGASSLFSCYKDINPIIKNLPSWLHSNLNTFPKVSHWGLGFQCIRFKGATIQSISRREKWPCPVWLTWLECRPTDQKVADLITGQSTYLGCVFNPCSRRMHEATNGCLFSSLSTSLPPFLSLNINILLKENHTKNLLQQIWILIKELW